MLMEVTVEMDIRTESMEKEVANVSLEHTELEPDGELDKVMEPKVFCDQLLHSWDGDSSPLLHL